jgi:hypothetical protein
MFITVDRRGGLPVTAEFEADLRRFLERFRMAGYDLEVDAPQFVPLEIELDVCVKPGFFPGDVHAALRAAFSAGDIHGFFHPDRFTFEQPLYLSQLISAAMTVPGVDWVKVTRFRRWAGLDDSALDSGVLTVERLEVIRLDNDPSMPENGRIAFNLRERQEANR